MSMSGSRAVRARRSQTPLSLRMLPKKSIPSSGSPEGTRNPVKRSPKIGKRIRSTRDTLRGGFILMRLSLSVVSRRIKGGCMIGTRAM